MKFGRVFALICISLIIGIILSYKNSDEKRTLSTRPSTAIEISINALGDSLKNKYPTLISEDRQPAGLSFYKADWSPNNKGFVRLNHGTNSFDIDNVLSVVGTQDEEQKELGIFKYSIVCGISGPNGVDHANARDYLYAIMDKMKGAGWGSTIPFSAPRLSGKDMLAYLLESGEPTTLGNDYKPTLDEWMKLDNMTAWELYAGGAFVRLSFIRDRGRLNVKKPGGYLINIEFKSNVAYFKSFVDPNQRDTWQALLPTAIKTSIEKRMSREQQLIKKGISIRSEYVDPPLPR